MADARTEKQKVKEITDRLEEGLKELFEGEKYKSYLNTMSKFHNYSANNIQLIEMQCPDATYVAGYKAWQKNFERHVNRGERGIRILAPSPYKIKEEQEKIDPDTNEPVLDRDGMPVVEEVEIKIPAFRVVTVFDYSQTDGKELPGLGVSELHGDVERYRDFMEALARVSPVPIRYEGMEGDRKGYFIDLNHPIAIKEGMGEAQTAKTGVHEVAHAKLHAKEVEQETGIAKDRETKEVEAESIAYTVCQHFGIDTSDYSFGYIAGWSSGKEMPELKSSLDTIRRTSSELIKGIEAQLLEIDKERAAEQAQEDIILLVANTDRSEYDLLGVRGMERTELFNSLLDMKDDDRQSVEAYLERAGAWVTLLGNERSEEVEEYHLDYAYNTDTYEITDFKALQEERERANKPIEYADVVVRIAMPENGEYETIKITNMQSEVENALYDMLPGEGNEWGGSVTDYLKEKGFECVTIMKSGGVNDGYPQFYDFEVDMGKKEIHAASELPIMQQAEQLINLMEFHRSVYSIDERNLIMNHAFKLDDMGKTTSLAYSLAEQKDDLPLLLETKEVAQAEIDALPDGMVGLSEMHEYGYLWNEMLPLTKERASELFEEGMEVYLLHSDGSETLAEDWGAVQGHDGLFGVEQDDWSAYLEQGLEEDAPSPEMRLLYGNESRFGIYQLKDTEETRDIRFMAMDYLEMKGIPVSKENYTLVYTGELKEGMSLEDIYTRFNIDRPADFTGHSLSVSDVVVLHQDGENTSHYVDSVGYREIPEFTKELSVFSETREEKNSDIGDAAEVMENTAESGIQKEEDADKFTYYVIEDLSARVGSNPEKGEVERFDSLAEAITKFKECREREDSDQTGMTKAVFGFGINGKEFDVLHVKNNQNCVPLEFTQNEVENSRFKSDLQTLYQAVGFDRAEVYRERTPEETKDLVKELFEFQLKTSGIDDVSMYMDRFDILYEQGKMGNLMPEGEQNHILENIPFAEWKNPYIDASGREETELAFQLADRYISIQEASEGYDYTIYDMSYWKLDGGVYDNPDITIRQALDEIVADLKEPAHRSALEGNIQADDELIPIDYDGLMEKAEQAEMAHLEERIRNEVPEAAESKVVADFKARTEELWNGINGQTQEDIELTIYAYLQSKIDEYDMDIELVDVAVSGSRCRGLEQDNSDLDVVVEYRGGETEDFLFNTFNEDGLSIGGVKVDINPITEGKTGTLGQYLPGVESYLAERRAALQERNTEQAQEEKQTAITLTVAECGEFHNLGEYHEDIASVEEAIEIFNQIPPERMNGIRSIGINIHTEGTEAYEDTQMDIVSGRTADLEILDYVPDITDNPKAVAVIAELIDKLPDIEVLGSLEKWQAAFLAAEIDQLSYDYDTYQYNDTVKDREAQVANIAEDIRNGNTEYLNDFLNAMISDSMREGITDLFGKGTELDDSEGVQTARKAKELLDKLAEYKPLAKIEELEECNYNMIDNVLNNEKPKEEKEHKAGRVSIKEKLAEKKAVIEQRDKSGKEAPEKGTEKKSEREI
ncbi:YodL domain-containing protein [[Clostridium] symbiosum]|uniref:YodL domain-containing protein n=1 Tax=Clostridium symbiosum TaxID=1512 RepID=UPI0018997FBD|nr:YodL domain-containing protein [[Clostridium] symbiosum]